jgi:hypothetical protein
VRGADRGWGGTTDWWPAYRRPSGPSAGTTVATSGDACRDVTLFTSGLRAGNIRPDVRGRGFLVRRGRSDAQTGGRSNGAPGSPRGHPASAGGLLVASLRPRHLADVARHLAENDRRSASTPGGRRCAGVELVVASCVAPRWLCVLPRSNLPRFREAHGCAMRSRDTARAPHMLRRWLWLVLLDAASRSCARSATVGRRRQLADRGMQLVPANLPRRAVHSQTHPPSTADHTAGPEPKQEKVSARGGTPATTMSQVTVLVNVR